MNKKEYIDFWKHRIVMLQSVLEDITMWNVDVFRSQILPLRNINTDKYWQMIEAWYDRIQKGEVVSYKTKLI